MKNLKPSQLPENTVIGKDGPHYEGLYIKRAGGVWEDLFSGCGCCTDSEKISDAGCVKDETYYGRGGMTTTKTSDEYFEDYKVIAVPPGFSFGDLELDIHGDFSYRTMTYADGTAAHNCERVNCEE
jgi:hypothetical protein